MASLCTRNVGLAAPARRATVSRKVVAPRAFLKDAGDYFASSFLKTFTPANDKMTRADWKDTGAGFKGKISHHEGGRKPFRDGYTANPKLQKRDIQKAAAAKAAAEGADQGLEEGSLNYLLNAAARVVGHNFKGDTTEPKKWSGVGWTGRRPERDSFHVRKSK